MASSQSSSSFEAEVTQLTQDLPEVPEAYQVDFDVEESEPEDIQDDERMSPEEMAAAPFHGGKGPGSDPNRAVICMTCQEGYRASECLLFHRAPETNKLRVWNPKDKAHARLAAREDLVKKGSTSTRTDDPGLVTLFRLCYSCAYYDEGGPGMEDNTIVAVSTDDGMTIPSGLTRKWKNACSNQYAGGIKKASYTRTRFFKRGTDQRTKEQAQATAARLRASEYGQASDWVADLAPGSGPDGQGVFIHYACGKCGASPIQPRCWWRNNVSTGSRKWMCGICLSYWTHDQVLVILVPSDNPKEAPLKLAFSLPDQTLSTHSQNIVNCLKTLSLATMLGANDITLSNIIDALQKIEVGLIKKFKACRLIVTASARCPVQQRHQLDLTNGSLSLTAEGQTILLLANPDAPGTPLHVKHIEELTRLQADLWFTFLLSVVEEELPAAAVTPGVKRAKTAGPRDFASIWKQGKLLVAEKKAAKQAAQAAPSSMATSSGTVPKDSNAWTSWQWE